MSVTGGAPRSRTGRDASRRRNGNAWRQGGSLRRYLVGCAVIFLCTTIAASAAALGVVSTIAYDFTLAGKPLDSKFLTPASAGAPETILVMGDDHIGPTTTYATGAEQTVDGAHLYHADTFMLVRMDPNQGETSILSIPRDLLVSFNWKGVSYTGKFNSTYSLGGSDLVKQVVLKLFPGLTINHVIDFNFSSFTGLVDAIGCVYIDVDHRYLNPSAASGYQPINIQPGYQRLCGNDALNYVRFRHTDSDFVRVARQQDFIRQAKEQLGVWGFLSKWQQLAKLFGESVSTDIRGEHTILTLLQLAAFSQQRPLRQVPFLYDNADYEVETSQGLADAVTATPGDIKQSLDSFLYVRPSGPSVEQAANRSTPKVLHQQHHAGVNPLSSAGLAAADLYPLPSSVTQQTLQMSPQVPFPIYLPSVQTGPAQPNDVYHYRVGDEQHQPRYGYRVDWEIGAGLYYGIEGMNWTNPPLFANPSATEKIGNRTYMFVNDGSNIQYLGWREGGELYWVSNTLLDSLSARQMLDLAETAQPLH